ncbi:hypothetical protein ACFC1R_26630 [Kitasatospora sp. NPDC056138]|uniref:hypothetical protein n=1 Tax=Kitasatospora sp. NPDC056138 TaxID=3345724 RepID=UPI0035D5509C
MTTDPVLSKSGFAPLEPHGPEVAGYFHQHPFERNPEVRGPLPRHSADRPDRTWAALDAHVIRPEGPEAPSTLLCKPGAGRAGHGLPATAAGSAPADPDVTC